ncbi:hypothetical protein K3495_g7598 [Podosphaera aphanis]|nr:hypothetical protein K3495_g7598 [Podosphaera aphanis]
MPPPSNLSAESKLSGVSDVDDEFQNNDITISSITFATADDVNESIKESKRKTEIWSLTDRLKSIDAITPVPILRKNNWLQRYESVENLLFLSQTSAAFLPQLPRNKAIRVWSAQ